MVYKTTDIAKAFQTYYSALYLIRNKETQKEKETRKIKIKEYLTDANPPKIQVEQLIELEEPITQDEIKKALK